MPDSRPTFSLIHTTARLPDGWKAAHDAWLKACVNPADVEYVVAVDAADRAKWPDFPESAANWRRGALTINSKRQCAVDGWNRAAEASTGRFLLTVSDDILPCKRWDEEIRKVVPDMSKEVVLDVGYGEKAEPGFLFFSFLTRARYERIGYVFYPEYMGYKGDDDFTMEAQRDKVIVNARHLVFPHLHPTYGQSKMDEIYLRQKRTDAIGHQVFQRRWGARSYLHFVEQSKASYIVRGNVGAGPKPVATPGACPKCHSPLVAELTGGQRRCRNCSLMFAAPHKVAEPTLESVIQSLAIRLELVEQELRRMRGESNVVKGAAEWSESALQN